MSFMTTNATLDADWFMTLFTINFTDQDVFCNQETLRVYFYSLNEQYHEIGTGAHQHAYRGNPRID